MAINYGDLTASGQTPQFAQDIAQAVGYKPVTENDISQALSQYGVTYNKANLKGKSDTTLYNRAVTDVLTWYKKQQADKKAADEAAQKAAAAAAQEAAQQAAAAKAAAAKAAAQKSSGGASSSSSGGGTMPDTATSSTPAPSTAPLPDIYLSASAIKYLLSTVQGASTSWIPPKSATSSNVALLAWARAQVKIRQSYQRIQNPPAPTPTPTPIYHGFRPGMGY